MMNPKPPFEAEHNCICAFADMPILEFYKDYYDTVFVMLHPFYKSDGKGNITKLVSWVEVLSLTCFNNISQLDIALRNNIGGLVAKMEK